MLYGVKVANEFGGQVIHLIADGWVVQLNGLTLRGETEGGREKWTQTNT